MTWGGRAVFGSASAVRWGIGGGGGRGDWARGKVVGRSRSVEGEDVASEVELAHDSCVAFLRALHVLIHLPNHQLPIYSKSDHQPLRWAYRN